MALPVFPAIQSPDMVGGVTDSTYKPTLRTETDGNLIAVRPRASISRKRFTLKWSKMPATDKETLERFFSINQGTQFSFTNPADGGNYNVVFADDQIQFSSAMYDGSIGEMRYSCTINLEETGSSLITSNNELLTTIIEVTITDYSEQPITFQYIGDGQVLWGEEDDLVPDDLDGDGDNLEEASHSYNENGVYTITIFTNRITRLIFNSPFITKVKRCRLPEGTTSVASMFAGTNITEIPDDFIHPETVTSARNEFYYCPLLSSVSGNFRNVDATTDVENQFSGCSSLTTIGNGFSNGANTIYCKDQFSDCELLTALPSTFKNSPAATNLKDQFYNCNSLTSIPWNNVFPEFTSNSVDISGMFHAYSIGSLTGTAPASRLWQRDIFMSYRCFEGQANIYNYTDIPATFGGTEKRPEVVMALTYNGSTATGVTGSVTLTRGNWTQTKTISNGTVTFTDVPWNVEYLLTLEAPGYTLATETVWVTGSSIITLPIYDAIRTGEIRFKVTITNASNPYYLRIAAPSGGTATIFWNDTTTTTTHQGTTFAVYSHTYPSPGTYIIRLKNAARIALDGNSSPTGSGTYGAMVSELLNCDLSRLTTLCGAFANLANVHSVPPTLRLPNNRQDLSYVFYHTPLSEIPETLWPSGFSQTTVNISHAFEQASVQENMEGTIPGSILWNNSSVTWTPTDCFKNCNSLDNYEDIPSSWGGGN